MHFGNLFLNKRTRTSDEIERRTRQIESLQSRAMHMQKAFEDHNMNLDRDRTHLLGATGLARWDDGDDEIIGRYSEEQSVDSLRNEQKRMLAGINTSNHVCFVI